MLLSEARPLVQVRGREDGGDSTSAQIALSIITGNEGGEHDDLLGNEVESMPESALMTVHLLQSDNEGIVFQNLSGQQCYLPLLDTWVVVQQHSRVPAQDLQSANWLCQPRGEFNAKSATIGCRHSCWREGLEDSRTLW